MLQSGKRKYIRPETVSKYINVFSQEELEYVRSFDPVKRTLVPSNPETVSVRVPVPDKNTGPKKNEPVVKSGKNPSFSADDIRNVVRNNTTIANTLKTYESRINPLMNLFNPKNGDFAAIYKNSFKTIVKKVSDKYKNPSAYLQFLLWVSEKVNVTNNINVVFHVLVLAVILLFSTVKIVILLFSLKYYSEMVPRAILAVSCFLRVNV